MNKIYPTYQEIHAMYLNIVQQAAADKFVPDVIIAPMRGGADIGVKLSHYYNVPLISPTVQFRDGNTAEVEIDVLGIASYSRILVADDISDSGKTFAELNIFLQTHVHSAFIKYAATYANTGAEHGNFVSYAGQYIDKRPGKEHEGIWIVWPWEWWWCNQ